MSVPPGTQQENMEMDCEYETPEGDLQIVVYQPPTHKPNNQVLRFQSTRDQPLAQYYSGLQELKEPLTRIADALDRISAAVERMAETNERMTQSLDRMANSMDRMAETMQEVNHGVQQILQGMQAQPGLILNGQTITGNYTVPNLVVSDNGDGTFTFIGQATGVPPTIFGAPPPHIETVPADAHLNRTVVAPGAAAAAERPDSQQQCATQ